MPADAARNGAPRVQVPPEHAGLYERYAGCRTEGHEWRRLGRADGLDAPPRFYDCIPFASRCNHCGEERTRWLTRSGLSAGTTYRYPEHYQQHGDDKLTRQDWGALYVRTQLTPAPAAPARPRKAG